MARRGVLLLAPWRRAPLLLLRAPGVLAAVAGAGFLLTLAVASRPVFLGSAGAAAVQSDISDGCRYEVGLRVTAGRIARTATPDAADVGAIAGRTQLLHRRGPAQTNDVQPVVTTVQGGTGEFVTPRSRSGDGTVQLYSRTGAFDHVNVIAGPAAAAASDGVWLPDTTAASLGLGPGDPVQLRLNNVAIATTVAAVFQDMTYLERPKFWCGMTRAFEPLGSNPLPPVAVATQDQLLRWLDQAGRPPATVTWELAPADGLSLPEADAVSDRLAAIERDLRNPSSLAQDFGNADGLLLHLGMPITMEHAHDVAGQVRTTADTVGTAGTAIALVAVAAAGFFWVDRRRNEVALLLAKGVGPVALATKAALEAVIPVVVGGALGAVAAVVVTRAFGPSDAFDRVATAEAGRLSAFAAIGALALLGAAAGIRVRRAEQRMAGVPHHAKAAVPLLLGALTAGALAAGIAIESAAGFNQLGGDEPDQSLGLVVVVFPLLVLAGGGGLAAVLGHLLLPRTRRMGRGWPTAPYLALRRVASAGPLALALMAGAVLSAGILLYASVVAESARATVVAKAGIGVGADMAAFLATEEVPPLPADLDRRATSVLRTGGHADDDGATHVAFLGIDRTTFARGALYDTSFTGRPLGKLLAALDEPTDDGAVPVIVADPAGLPDRFAVEGVRFQAVARVKAFPGITGEQPLLVADEKALRDKGIRGSRQLWIRGSTSSVQAQLDRARVPVVTMLVAKTNQAASSLLPLATSLGYFKALGVLGGTVTLCGAVFYLASRERARRLAGVMTRGMGLSRRAARAALALELGALLLVGLVLGGGLSSWAAKVTFPHLDPSPGTPPSLIFRWDRSTPLVAALVTVLAAAAMAGLSERASSRRLAAEVIRDA